MGPTRGIPTPFPERGQVISCYVAILITHNKLGTARVYGRRTPCTWARTRELERKTARMRAIPAKVSKEVLARVFQGCAAAIMGVPKPSRDPNVLDSKFDRLGALARARAREEDPDPEGWGTGL